MGVQENRVKSQKFAEYMKKHGIRRTSFACPWGCGSLIGIDGAGGNLLSHLSRCRGGAAAKRSRGRFSKKR